MGNPTFLKPVRVSEQMRAEGLRVYEDLKDSYSSALLVEEIYIAMSGMENLRLRDAKPETRQSLAVRDACSDD